MEIDLNALSRSELETLITGAQKALSTLAERERQAALDAVEQAAREHGFSLKELTGLAPTKAKSRGKIPPKYRNPEDPSATWSGRGRKPQWIKDAEAAGTDIAEFKI
ncbi:H-NS histone family protein [Aliiruegeria sabulilitoris]|uniref:H-NS histone family protein n=1 Tax=Aliiruegeria sabulilitoris TaxID=1510458 RepID=UPI000831EFEC|nr:H-NS histone family protein [Aliiruegeria sabulilitoris]NDR58975.1 H-NS histone family protein [Pseudoruegeria sp. M32A2M]